MPDVVLILTTAPAGDAGKAIARVLVDERLAACVNVLAPMTSVYRWQGAVEHETEQQLIIKTTHDAVDALWDVLRARHPYDTPEFVVVPIIDGSEDYLAWVARETRGLQGRVPRRSDFVRRKRQYSTAIGNTETSDAQRHERNSPSRRERCRK
jgi:periplasmic divalent cation tolerance protein